MTSRSRYSFSELADYARRGGWSEEEIPQAVAIAMAESGGNPLALNDNPSTGDKSFGLMQINMIGGLGPERARQFGLSRYEDLYDPVRNFQAAKAIRDSQGWPAWSVYKSGRYKDYLPGVQQSLSAAGAAQTPQSDGFDLLNVGLGGSGAPAQGRAISPLAAMFSTTADALVQQSLVEAASRSPELGRKAMALEAQQGVINALFGGEKPQAVAAAPSAIAPPAATATATAGFTGGGGFIARTGNSGVSTGPHLDARWADGRPITPQALDQYLNIGGKAPSAWTLTSGYGPRQAPTAGASSFHKGVDLGIPAGTPIYATGKARLKQSLGEQGGAGYMVTVETPEGDLNLLHLTPGSSPLSRA